MEMPHLGLPAEQSIQEPPQMGESNIDSFEFLVELLLDNWRRTGEIGGIPVPDEGQATEMAVTLAMAQMQQAQAGQQLGMAGGAPAMPSPEGDNPLLAALRGGVR